VLGVVFAYSRQAVLPDEEVDTRPRIAPDTFVADLGKTVTRNGKKVPTVHRIVVYPPVEGKHFVVGQRWDALRDQPDHATANAFSFHASIPFTPPGQRQPPRPEYTVRDLLDEAVAQHEHLSYRYAWWRESAKAYALWVGLSLVMIGAGLGGKREAKIDYDLDRFKSEPSADTDKRKAMTAAELDQLKAVQAQLEANLKPSGLGHDVAGHDQPPSSVKQLNSGPVEPVLAPHRQDEEKDYTGEFYPVARPHGKKDH
jgi:hypothetical protein